ncbi:hypothetical protein GGG16DRAFT_106553 [Schizophyllum commune]
MSQPGTRYLLAMAALAAAGDDEQAKAAAFDKHSEALMDIMSGTLGPARAQSLGNMVNGMTLPSASDTSHSSTVAAPLPLPAPNAGLPSMPPPQVPPPLALQTPASEPAPTPSAGPPAMEKAPRTLGAPSADRSTSASNTERSTTRLSPASSRGRDVVDVEDISDGDEGPKTVAKRKRDEGDAPTSPTAAEASSAGRKLRDRRPKTDKEAESSTRRAAPSRAPRAKGGKGKKKAEFVGEKGDGESDRESVVYVSRKSNTSRLTTTGRKPSPPPKQRLINDLPCTSCEKAGATCLRRETARPATACQRCSEQKSKCSLTKESGASHVEASPPPNSAPAAAPAPSAAALLGQDPLGLAELSAGITRLCAFMERFNDHAAAMNALLGGIEDFSMRVAELKEYSGRLQSIQAAGGGSLPPPSSSPSSPSRDVSPGSHGSRKRRRLDLDLDTSSTVPGAAPPSPALAGASGAAGGPAEAVGAVPGGSSEVASPAPAPAPAPSGPAGGPSTPPRASAEASAEAAAKETSGSGGSADMDVDKTPTH